MACLAAIFNTRVASPHRLFGLFPAFPNGSFPWPPKAFYSTLGLPICDILVEPLWRVSARIPVVIFASKGIVAGEADAPTYLQRYGRLYTQCSFSVSTFPLFLITPLSIVLSAICDPFIRVIRERQMENLVVLIISFNIYQAWQNR